MTGKSLNKQAAAKLEIEAHISKAIENTAHIHYLSQQVAQLHTQLENTQFQLTEILSSSRWKLSNRFFSLLERTKVMSLINALRTKVSVTKPKPAMIESIKDLAAVPEIPVIYNIFPYKNIQVLKDIDVTVIDKRFVKPKDVHFSMATPIWNEQEGIIAFLKSIQNQTLKPDELILTDGGSSDDTVHLIEEFAQEADFKIIVIKEKRVPIATGRNLAIKRAKNEIIVMADAGTVLDKNCCLNLVSCFKAYGKPDLVGGIWLPITATEHTAAFIPDWQHMDWNRWLTSTRSMAIKKSLIKKAGYFPEYVFYGDDTLFGVKYRRISKKWVFNTQAITYWDAPVTREQYIKTSRNYGKGDGENGLGEYFYPTSLVQAAKFDQHNTQLPVRKDFLDGYLEGRMNRSQIETNLRKIKGIIVYLTVIPFYENEHTVIFKEILKSLKNNYKVICVHLYPNIDSLVPKKFLDIDYTLLELYYIDDLDIPELYKRYRHAKERIQVVVEDRNPRFDPLLQQLHKLKIPVKFVKHR